MKKILFLLIVAAIITIFVVLINHDPGKFLISYGSISIETNLWIALLACVCGGILIYLAGHLLKIIMHFLCWSNITHYLSVKKNNKSTGLAVESIINNQWLPAYNYLQSITAHQSEPVYKLLLAYLAYRGQKLDSASNILSSLEQTNAVKLLQADIYLAADNPQPALDILQEQKNAQPVNQRLLKVYLATNAWQILLNKHLAKCDFLSDDQLIEYYQNIIAQYISSEINQDDKQDSQANKLIDLWRQLPHICQQDSRVANYIVKHLLLAGCNSQAQSIIEIHIKKYTWDEGLVNQYHLVAGADKSKLLDSAEKWLINQPQSPALLLTLGYLCIDIQLWGKAKTYLEKSFILQPQLNTLDLQVNLLQQLGQNQEAQKILAAGLKKLCTHQP
jgi:HemY protein